MVKIMIDASKIREIRAALGESQTAFAARFGLNQSTIDRWEDRGPPPDKLTQLAIEQILSEIEASK